MTKSPPVDLELFDLKQGEKAADDQPVFKEEFPVSHVEESHVKDAGSARCVDNDTVGGEFKLEEGVLVSSMGLLEENFDNKEKDFDSEAVQQANSIMHENHTQFRLDEQKCKGSVEPETEDTNASGGVPSPGTSQMDLAHSGSPSSNESVDDVDSEADQCMSESSPSSPDSRIAENSSLNGYGADHCVGNFDMDDANMEAVLYPDYVIYQGNYYTGPELTFSHCGIKINSSIECLNQAAFSWEWAVDDLIDIKCQVIRSMGAVVLKLQVNDTSGIEVLKIAVADSNWSVRHKQIISLNEKYLAKWIAVIETDVDGDENDLLEPKHYFPNFDEPFDEVVYPKGDPDAVSISKRDVDLLQPDTFINDTVIDFYINYLKNQIQEEEKHRFHFFNSFFFRKLADMDKNPSSASDGKAAFLRVRKWTRKVNLFEKDYIFIPVNFNLHWSLIVICHPGEAVSLNDEDLDKSVKVPCILHMDSIKGSHSGLKTLIQSYLWEEWRERRKDTLEENDLSTNFLNMRFVALTLPQQENCYDCGLFLLHYLELFLAEAPVSFNPLKLTKFSSFLNADWFPPAEAYLKRTLIQRLIFELLENRSREVFSSNFSDKNHYSENNENRNDVEFLTEECSRDFNQVSTASHSSQGIEITLLSAASSLDPQSFNSSGLVLRDLFEPGAATGALSGECQSFDHRSSAYHLDGSVFPMEEDTETGEQFMCMTTDANFQQVSGVTPQTCELPLLSKDYGYETCQKPEISLPAELGLAPLSQDTSSCASDDSDDVGIIENCPIGNEGRASEEARLVEENCSTMENVGFLTENTISAATCNEGGAFEEIKQDEKTCSSVENLDSLAEVSAAIGYEGKASEGAKLVKENCSSMENLEFLTEITVSAATCNEGGTIEETKQDKINISSVENQDCLTEVTGSAVIGLAKKAPEEAKLVEENCSSKKNLEFLTEITVSANACNEEQAVEETKQDERNCSSVENLDGLADVTGSAAIGHEGKASEEAKPVEQNCSSVENLEFLTEITVTAATCNVGGVFEETEQDEKNISSVEDLENSTEVMDSAAISHPGKAPEEAKLIEENCSSMNNLEFSTEVTVSAATCNEGGVFEGTKRNERNCSSVENLGCLTEITGSAAIGDEGKVSEEAKQEEENSSFMECSTEITVPAPICNEGAQTEETKRSEENCSSLQNLECSTKIALCAATGNGASSEKVEQDEGDYSSMEILKCSTEVTVSAATGNGEGASKEPKQDEKANSCTEDLMSCTEVTDSAANNLPIDSVVESSQDISMASNGNYEILHSNQETLAVPQPQLSEAGGDKRTCDKVHMIDDEKSDISEEQAAKKRRLMPLDDESDSISNL